MTNEQREPGAADLMIAQFFQKWAPAASDKRARFHLDFVRIVQQITLDEAARPYHMLLRDALAQQPLARRETNLNCEERTNDKN